MKCAAIMSTPVRTVSDQASALVAASLMRDHRVGFLPVCDDVGRIVGVVTERDLALQVCAENAEARDILVSDIMTGQPITCRSTQSVAEVQRQMNVHRHSVIAIVDERDRPVGTVSLWDIHDSADLRGSRRAHAGVPSR